MYQCVGQWSWDGLADAGMWMHQAQELVGETCTVGGILLYSDKTSILNNQMCYPVYSKSHMLQTCFKHASSMLQPASSMLLHASDCSDIFCCTQWQLATRMRTFWTPTMDGNLLLFCQYLINRVVTMARTKGRWKQPGNVFDMFWYVVVCLKHVVVCLKHVSVCLKHVWNTFLSRRQNQVFHDGIKELCKSLKSAFDNPETIVCNDGWCRTIRPLVAAWLGDREEHEVISQVIKVMETCLKHAWVCSWHAWSMLGYVLSLFFVYDVCRTTAKFVLLVCCLHWTTRPSTTWKSCNKPSRMHWKASGQAGGTQDQDQLRQVQPLLRTPMGSSTTRQRRMNCRANSSFTSCTMRQLFSPSLTPSSRYCSQMYWNMF